MKRGALVTVKNVWMMTLKTAQWMIAKIQTAQRAAALLKNGDDERTKPLSQSERLKLHMRLELAKRK
jgi:hypothetical protein